MMYRVFIGFLTSLLVPWIYPLFVFRHDPHQVLLLNSYHVKRSPDPSMFDYQQLKRWSIPEQTLPPDAIVVNRFKSDSFLDTYGTEVFIAGVVFLVLVIIIVILIVNIVRRQRVEVALRESQSRLTAMAKSFPNGAIILYDHDLRYLLIGGTGLADVGLSSEKMRGKTIHENFAPDVVSMIEPYYLAGLNGRQVAVEIPFGGRIYIMHVQPLRGDDGEITAGIVITQDITDQKQAELALRESETQYRLLADSIKDVVSLHTTDGKIVYISPSITRIAGWTPEELIGRNIGELVHPNDETQTLHQFKQSLFSESPVYTQWRCLCKDGAYLWIETVTHSTPGSDDRPARMVASSRDISDRKRDEAERVHLVAQISGQAQEVQQIIDTVPEGVLLLDQNHRVIRSNPVGKQDLDILAGIRVGECLTRLGPYELADILAPPPKGFWHELELKGPAARMFELIARPIENGPTRGGHVIVIRDVTREREIQQRAQLQDRLAAVGQLAAGVAHDFNNIMAIIVLHIQIVLQTSQQLSPKARERLETIAQQAHRAADLIEQILDFSRQSIIERRTLQLVPFLKEQVRLFERTLPENIAIKLTTMEVGPYLVSADLTRLQQVMMNLVVNARDSMPDGGKLNIVVSFLQIDSQADPPVVDMEPGQWVTIAVSDTGAGIPPDVLPHIFEPFFTTKAPGKGSGLGLAQVYGIVTQHGGHLDVTSKANQGTTFTIYLPALQVPASDAIDTDPYALVQGHGETILVVEDDQDTRNAVIDGLSLLNYQVLMARNGDEALAVWDQHQDEIALVLSDAVMPGKGGIALFEDLRRRGSTARLILLTGHSLENQIEDLKNEGLFGWLLKPVGLERLAATVAQALNESEA